MGLTESTEKPEIVGGVSKACYWPSKIWQKLAIQFLIFVISPRSYLYFALICSKGIKTLTQWEIFHQVSIIFANLRQNRHL